MFKNILTSVLLFASALSQAQELEGKVLDAETGSGIPYAKLMVRDHGINGIADENGNFKLTGSLPWTFTLYVTSLMHEPLVKEVSCCDTIIIKMTPIVHHIDEIVVVQDPRKLHRDNTMSTHRLNAKELEVSSPGSLVDAATQITGVQQISSGPSSAKPVIRGMSGMRVLSMLNGMRIENQQWGGDHGLGVSQVGVGSMEVLKGPSGLMFAGDAIGGILYIEDESFAPQNTYSLSFNSRFESVNLGTQNSIDYKVSKKNFRFSIAGYSSSNADYQLTNGKYLSDSRFQDHGSKFSLGANKGRWNTKVNYLFSHSYVGLPGHTHDSLVTPESFMLDYQNRSQSLPQQKIQNHFINVLNTFYLNGGSTFKLQASHTFNDFYEFEEKIFTPAINLKLNASSLQMRYRLPIGENIVFNSGAQSSYQSNVNGTKAEEQLLIDSRQVDNGAYSSILLKMGAYKIKGTARLDSRILTGEGFERSFITPNIALGLATGWQRKTKNHLFINTSSGTRVPHVSELTADGQHHGASRYEKGNLNLKPERFTQIDVEYELSSDHISVFANPFYTYINDYIQLTSTNDTINNAQVFEYQSIEKAQLYGLDAGIHYHPHFFHNMHLELKYSSVYGEDMNRVALNFIPPPRIQTNIRFKLESKKKIGFTGLLLRYQYYFEQNRIGMLETITGDYHLVQVGAQLKWELKYPLSLSFGVRNALNETYVQHLSPLKRLGLTEPGRSFYINLKMNIPGELKSNKK